MSTLNAPTVGSVPGPQITPGPGQTITIRSVDGRYVLTGIAGPEPAEVSAGRGGWEEKQRNRKPAITQWVGSSARKTTVTILLDAWSSQGSVEPALKVMDGLAPPVPTVEPPQVTVSGAPGVPSTVRWVVESVTPSERLRRADGATTRIQLEFSLLEYRPGDVVVSKTDPAKRSVERNATPPAKKAKTHTVKKGDTLSKLAAKYLGSASKWNQIATLNKLRNPNNLRVGQVLKLP